MRFKTRYRLDRLVRTDRLRSLFDAVDEEANEPVTVEVFQPEEGQRGSVLERVEAGAPELVALASPELVRLLDFGGLPDRTIVLVHEYHGLHDLRARRKHGQLRVEEVVVVVASILRALSPPHAQGLVHRDLRPEHIRVELGADGRVTRARVAGFGVSHLVAGSEQLVLGGKPLGDPRYMAPEQFMSGVTPRADVYAIAMLAYEMLCGVHFIEEGTSSQVVSNHLNTPRPPLESTPTGEAIPKALAHLLARAGRPNKGARFSEAAEMLVALGPLVPDTVPPASKEGGNGGAEVALAATLMGIEAVDLYPGAKSGEKASLRDLDTGFAAGGATVASDQYSLPDADDDDGLAATLMGEPITSPGGDPGDDGLAPTLVGESIVPSGLPGMGDRTSPGGPHTAFPLDDDDDELGATLVGEPVAGTPPPEGFLPQSSTLPGEEDGLAPTLVGESIDLSALSEDMSALQASQNPVAVTEVPDDDGLGATLAGEHLPGGVPPSPATRPNAAVSADDDGEDAFAATLTGDQPALLPASLGGSKAAARKAPPSPSAPDAEPKSDSVDGLFAGDQDMTGPFRGPPPPPPEPLVGLPTAGPEEELHSALTQPIEHPSDRAGTAPMPGPVGGPLPSPPAPGASTTGALGSGPLPAAPPPPSSPAPRASAPVAPSPPSPLPSSPPGGVNPSPRQPRGSIAPAGAILPTATSDPRGGPPDPLASTMPPDSMSAPRPSHPPVAAPRPETGPSAAARPRPPIRPPHAGPMDARLAPQKSGPPTWVWGAVAAAIFVGGFLLARAFL
jgi:serine/threonine-protein kinase